ncbi:MAG: hypothetical protein QGD90_00135 [Candidatus Hydrogenedentes bacterium]|nr:hypothetical protein [Candidatus Hydrogenedentota bacterium]
MGKNAAPKAVAPKNVMVVNNQTHLVHFHGTILRPGVNSVPAAVAEKMKAHPHIKKLCSVRNGKALEITKAAPSTKELSPDEAEALVGKTNDPEILDGYRDEDARPSVAKAIADKKEAIGPTAVKKG